MSFPKDVVAAATHPDPYQFYAGLAKDRPFGWDDGLGMWVAFGTVAVEAVLASGLCRVRPAREPVPAALVGTTAGEIFGRLVRMTDGDGHAPLKGAISAALATVDMERVASSAAELARTLWERDEAAPVPARVMSLAFDLSPYVVGSLLGIPDAALATVAGWMGDFVRCLAPASTPEQVERGIAAAADLAGLLTDSIRGQANAGRNAIDRGGENRAGTPGATSANEGGLLTALGREIERAGIVDEAVVVANGVGLLSQSYEATAGLIGNTLLAPAADAERYAMIVADPSRVDGVVRETLRRDPSIQSTRRVVDRDGRIAGQQVRTGDAILVLLAAANHDPATRADQERGEGCGHSLGAGAHTCPGGAIAVAVAAAGVRQIVAAGVSLPELAAVFRYRSSANARIPLFGEREGRA